MRVVLYCPNLLFAQRLRSAATAAGLQVQDLDANAQAADLLVVDLSEPGWDQAVAWAFGREPRPRILGFGPHVRADLFAAARAAGVDRCVANSKLAEDPASLMREAVRPAGPPD